MSFVSSSTMRTCFPGAAIRSSPPACLARLSPPMSAPSPVESMKVTPSRTTTTLGLGRLTVTVFALVTLYAALTAFWAPIRKIAGPVLIPLGEATLYVFVMHVAFALVVANIPVLEQGLVLPGTVTHALILAGLWIMVRKRVLFKLVPQ